MFQLQMSEAAGSTDEPEAGPSNQGQQRTVNSVKDMVLDAVMSDPDIMRAMNDGIRVESHEAKQQKHESTNGEPCKVSHEREEVKKYMSPLKDQDESIIAVGPQTDKLDWKNKEIDLKKQLDLLNLVMDKSGTKNVDEAKKKKYQFWETQPVPNFDESISDNGPIEADKPISELRKEPYSLPGGFVWKDVNLSNDKELKELYTLLNENYVEDDDNMFRFDYSPEFLLWALKPPGWNCDWHVGVRVAKSDKLIGFIAAVPCIATIYEKSVDMVEINFLCVHKKLRAKRVAPVLIREITRRVNMKGIFQAVYTAGVILPKPISTCRYWHRSLNPKKLIDVNFSHLGKNMTLARTLKLYRLPDEAKTPGLRQMTAVDIPVAYKLLTEYLNKFDIAPKFTMEEFQHWFAPRLDVVDSYVVEKNGDLVDFISFYTLPSTIMHHQQHKSLKAAYAFYNVANSTPWVELMTDALILAKKNGYDVFNALDLMDNKEFLEKLKFGIGDGDLQYYLYNWKCPEMTPNKVGLVLQ